MSRTTRIVIAVAVATLVVAAAVLAVQRSRDDGLEVRMEEVQRRDLVATVTASGNIRARRTVDISSDISARVASLRIREGEDVEPGQVLLTLEPTQYEAAVSRARAALSQARAQEAQQRANLLQAQREFDRLESLFLRDSVLVARQQLDDAETALAAAEANLESARFGVEQAQASLAEAEDRLSKTVIRAPMAGKVTRLNVEEGETVIIGTMNNPGSLILTISDLSTVEVVLEVDETDIPQLALDDSAAVDIDAFPEVDFAGRVTEIGNSAIQPPSSQTASQEAAVDFEVVITLEDPPVILRPDLSATAEIVTDTRMDAVAVPIIALTVRDRSVLEEENTGDAGRSGPGATEGDAAGADDVEGVFLVEDGRARFVAVEVGIAGREHFEVLSGLEPGQTVVSGPYQIIRELQNGDPVRRQEGSGGAGGPGGA